MVAKKDETVETPTGIPHVYTAVGEILKSLSVEKNGMLPSNMGGKPYISAVDLNLEIKRRFVEQGLVIFPTERIVEHQTLVGSTGRVTVAISVEGTYLIASTKDASTATIGGSGDGMSIGSSVAANIASTNALKNALLRTFLVTEQSAEDQAKEGVKDDAVATPPPTANAEAKEIKDRLKAKSLKVEGDASGQAYLTILVDSSDLGKPFLELWKNGTVDELKKLEAIFDKAQS